MANVADEAKIIRELLEEYLPQLLEGGEGAELDFSTLPDLEYALETTDEALINRGGVLSKATIDAIAYYMYDFLQAEGFVVNAPPVAELRLKAEGFAGTAYFKLFEAGLAAVDMFGVDANYNNALGTPLLVRYGGNLMRINVSAAGAASGLPSDARVLYLGGDGGGGAAVAPVVVAVGPADHGLIAWTQDPATASATVALGGGEIWLQRVKAVTSGPASNIHIDVQAVGAGLTAGQNLAALYSTAGALLGVTADQSTNWTSTGAKSMALTTPAAVVAGTSYYVALLSNGTTRPTVRRSAAQASLLNFNLSTAAPRFAQSGSGNTTMPSTITISSYSLATNGVFCGLS